MRGLIDTDSVLRKLQSMASKDLHQLSERRGVPVENLLGVSTADIRRLAKKLGKDKELAESLWDSRFHEARLLATLIFPPDSMSLDQLHRWVKTIDSWDTCDQFAKNLASKWSEVASVIPDWLSSEAVYVRRVALATIANYCMKSSSLPEAHAVFFLSAIEESASDGHQHVKQASCWALREFGKIDDGMHEQAIYVALQLKASNNRYRAWVGRCAYKELELLVSVPDRRRLISRKSKTAAKYI